MPPKRKGARKAAPTAAKKAKKEEAPKDSELKKKVQQLKQADKGKKKVYTVDSMVPNSANMKVFESYDCMLNQTNIGNNNNKYYIIQLLQDPRQTHYLWTRWGRVGEPGQNDLKNFSDVDSAVKAFKKKFQDKTKNNWDNREKFTPQSGKYTLIEVEAGDQEEIADTVQKLTDLDESDVEKKTAACTLDKSTQQLMQLIFDNDMFKEQMQNFELDLKKMPLGKLSKAQIAKGFEVLEEIEDAIAKKTPKSKLSELSSKFYTVIPHSFGRKIPPVISDPEHLQKKMDMLLVLGDIELAQSMQKQQVKNVKKETKEVPHPLDEKYSLLKCGLDLVDKKSKEYKVIDAYVKATGTPRELLNVWAVDRHDEGTRFKEHEDLDNRRLLWHGTNIAVVAAILKTGLRIMPHSGGRVGRGIYFASEHSKSAGYVRCTNKGIGIMFLNEVALGKEKHISRDDSSLRQAPSGFHSIVAKGRQEPDPSKDTFLTLGGKKVTVPQGKPLNQKSFQNSSFWQSEYLIYKESQNRIRYLLQFQLY